MGPKLVAGMIVAILLTLAVPLYIAKNLQLGSYAKSPQQVTMTVGSTMVIAGGRAKLWYAGGDSGGEFEIQCRKGSLYCHPMVKNEQFDGCGVTVQLIEVYDDQPLLKAKFKITWEDKK